MEKKTLKSGTEREIEGTVEKWTGKAKEAVGDLADDPGLREQGREEQRRGELREHAGKVQREAERAEHDAGE